MFHIIEVKPEVATASVSKGANSIIKVELGKATIYIPSEKSNSFSAVIKKILKLCQIKIL